ncbi:MAG: cytochrome c [Alphaproteobacteria bacterium]|nr:cytochrome c [Alphaproteobacteria bacterium]
MHKKAWLLASLLALAISGHVAAQSSSPSQDPDAEGKHVFRKANCMGCHKWDGSGGGGYGGAALSLRATQLTPDQIIHTVECGRPGTGMPYHMRGAYDDPAKPCDGLTRADLGKDMPPEPPVTYLRLPEIKAVVAYIIDHVKGKGTTTLVDCLDFWGSDSRVCNIYREKTQEKDKN